ncbi:DUF3566 domain-containing protein [Actinotalea solisilvae]|uniref:DUF3566 domain-containing protein n=1 Tax=Actinotalea solisilvae TaxID=2072922 RepID=UPI0018F1302E|nr:DUF3566 domain-containing protein [Actinotalea solisilvae]
MSADGTQPPSIAPKRPIANPTASHGPGGGGTTVRTPETPVRPAPGPSGAGSSDGDSDGPSFTERLKQSAQGAVDAARSALPTKDPEAPTTGTAAPATGAGAAGAAAGAAPRRQPTARTSASSTRTPSTSTTSPVASSAAGPRRVRLAVARIDPWSVMKLSFLLSVAVGIMIVVAAAVIWYTLDGLHVFTSVNDIIATLSGSTTFFDINDYAGFERVISLATMIAVVDIVLLTALSTIGAFLYNIVAALVGGVHLTLTDD